MKARLRLSLIPFFLMIQGASAVMERGEYPWGTDLRSYYDEEMAKELGGIKWLLNLGPTGIRARIYPDKPEVLVVKYVFQDAKSPAKGLVEAEDVIAGANGKKFSTPHRFGRNLPGGGGWDGPMLELAGHIEDSQGKDGLLSLTVWPKGEKSGQKEVKIQLRQVGRFAETFPYNCKRSEMMLEELCDFMVMDYKSGNWKKENSFGGGPHGHAHQLLALMASGIPKYDRIIDSAVSGYYGKTYDPGGGGFQMWNWGFDGIVMGEQYLLTKDRKLLSAMESLAAAMPQGCHNGNGIYTHRSEINLRVTGRKPYASIAAISGLQMLGMSLFKEAGLPYDERLHHNIHQHYLNSTSPEAVNIAYAFGNADKLNDSDIAHRHAIIKLKDPKKGLSGRGPGYVCPTGMDGIGEYEIVWPTKADPRWKPTDWLEKEAATNILTEHSGDGPDIRRVDRNNPRYKFAPEPTKPYKTTRTGTHLAPVGMGALSHLIGGNETSWNYLGTHAANTCVLGPGNGFDGHAASNLHAFWSVLGAARSDQPEKLRGYFDMMKTFLILSETHNGGLILQPWGRDRPDCNSDTSYGPRILPTATGAILLSLGKQRLRITGAGGGAGARRPTSGLAPPVRKARPISAENIALLDDSLLKALAELNHSGSLKPIPVRITKARADVWLAKVESNWQLTFQALQGEKRASFNFAELASGDRAALAALAAGYRADDREAQAMAGLYAEISGDTSTADMFFAKAGEETVSALDAIFE
ncbi:hypothetical protein HZ994_13695 [Akkermansiaceae bacterium]|nr:hypothetical protein HZ994_13695 [Akkermansiaceae bacterium]